MINHFKTIGLITQSSYIAKFSRDLFIPALPLLASQYSLKYNEVEVIISFYFLGIGLARITWTYWADQLCKKKILFFLYFFFILSTIGTILTHSFSILVFFRFSQAFFIASIPLIIRTTTHDYFGTNQSVKIYSYASVLTAWAPAITISIAAYYINYYNFNSLLWILILFSGFNCIFLYFFYTPFYSNTDQKVIISFKTTLIEILINKSFWLLSLPLSIVMTGSGIYQASSAYLLMHSSNLTLIQFSLSFFLLTACRLIGKLLTGKLIDFIDKQKIILCACLICLTSSTLCLLNAYYLGVNYYLIYGLMLYYFAMGMINPATKATLHEYFPDHKTTSLGYLMSLTSLMTFVGIGFSTLLFPSWTHFFFMLICLNLLSSCTAIFYLSYLRTQKTAEKYS